MDGYFRVVLLQRSVRLDDECSQDGGEKTSLDEESVPMLQTATRHDLTYEHEEGIDVVCKVGDHVFIVPQDLLLDEVPAFERDTVRLLAQMHDQWFRLR